MNDNMRAFATVKSIFKGSAINTDNCVFLLHYKASAFFLILSSVLVSQRQYFGKPINCDVSGVSEKHIDIIDTFCWINSTYTLPKTPKGEQQRHHKYYQWVPIVLLLQGLMFYIPKYLWMAWEGGRIKMLAADLNTPIVNDNIKKERNDMLVKYFKNNLNNYNLYAIKFFFCEILNFINIIGQMYFINRFLGGDFFQHGVDVLSISEEDIYTRHDHMDLVFPKVANCNFEMYGSSGSKQNHSALCILPLNIINEKIYIFLFCWFIIVAMVTGLALAHRIVTIFARGYRTILLRMRCPVIPFNNIQDVIHKCQLGDWFLLYQLAKNIDPLIYKQFIHDLAMKMRGNGPI